MNTYLIFIFVTLLSTSRLSMLQMQELGISLLAKLKAEPISVEITELITRLETILTSYVTELTLWNSDKSRTRGKVDACLLYTSPSPRDRTRSRMPSSA